LIDLRTREYKLKREVLEQFIRRRLLELEANKKGLSPDDLLKREVDSTVSEPSDAKAKGYYLGMKGQTTCRSIQSVANQGDLEEYRDSAGSGGI